MTSVFWIWIGLCLFSVCVKNINEADKEFRHYLDEAGQEVFDNFFVVAMQMSQCVEGGDIPCQRALFENFGAPTWRHLASMYRGDLKRLCKKQVAIDTAIVRKLTPLAFGCQNRRTKARATHLTCKALMEKSKLIKSYMRRQKTRKVPQREKNYWFPARAATHFSHLIYYRRWMPLRCNEFCTLFTEQFRSKRMRKKV